MENENLNNRFCAIDWDELFSTAPDIDSITERFTQILIDSAQECIPNKVVNIHSRDKPGITCEVRRLFRIAKRLHARAKRSQNPVHFEHFRNA